VLGQTAYARLLDTLMTAEAGDLEAGATLVSKTISGKRYWYVQRYAGGKKKQSYIGRESPALLERLERWKRAKKEAASRSELVAIARAAGAYTVSAAEARVLEQLAPVFHRGAVLVGSHAFAVLGTSLGARWQDAIVRTEDVDLVHDPNIAIAIGNDVEPVQLGDALGDAIPRFNVLHPTQPATTFQVRGTHIEVDLLTPLVGRDRKEPIPVPLLGAAAMPLRFLDYLIEDNQPGAIVGGHGALVRVPRPGRFALHKLIVADRRTPQTGGAAKSAKDRLQASALLELLATDLPGEITIAWKALEERGRNWTSSVRTSVSRLDADVIAILEEFGIRPAPRTRR
jgi:hypothetical protein